MFVSISLWPENVFGSHLCGLIVVSEFVLSPSFLSLIFRQTANQMLKLRISRPLVGRIRSITTVGVRRSKEELLKAVDGLAPHFSPQLPSSELIAQAMWHFNDNERYRRVKAAYIGLAMEEKSQSESATSAFLLANAETHEPWKTKELLTSFNPETVTPSMVTFLLHGYAVVDSLGSAERLMQNWMQAYLTKHPSDNETAELLRTLRAGSASASTPESEDSKTYDLAATSVGDHTIPLSAWVAMLTVYGKRKAWRQCTDILRYLEHKRDTGAAYTVPQLHGSDVVFQNLDEVLYPTYLITTDYLQVNHVAQSGLSPSFKQKSNLTRGANTGNVAALQWGALYHITLRALCETMQFEQVVDVLRRMKTAGEEQGALVSQNVFDTVYAWLVLCMFFLLYLQAALFSHSHIFKQSLTHHTLIYSLQSPQIPTAIALLSALWSPINPLHELSDIDSGSDGLRGVITAEGALTLTLSFFAVAYDSCILASQRLSQNILSYFTEQYMSF